MEGSFHDREHTYRRTHAHPQIVPFLWIETYHRARALNSVEFSHNYNIADIMQLGRSRGWGGARARLGRGWGGAGVVVVEAEPF